MSFALFDPGSPRVGVALLVVAPAETPHTGGAIHECRLTWLGQSEQNQIATANRIRQTRERQREFVAKNHARCGYWKPLAQ